MPGTHAPHSYRTGPGRALVPMSRNTLEALAAEATTTAPATPAALAAPPRRSISRRGLLGLGGLFTVGAGVTWALDRYVIEHAEVPSASTQWSTADTAASTDVSGTVSGLSYAGSNATIEITEHTSGSGSDTITWFVADIKLTSADALRSAFAKDTFGENIIENPSTIAAENGAVFAINGDYYGFRDTGIVIRNGVAFRDEPARTGLALHADGTLAPYDETSTSADALVADGVWQTWSFGPSLLDGGAVIDGIDSVEVDTNFGNHSIQGEQPRTGIGMIEANHLVAIVVDGRSSGYSRGVTMVEFAQMFADLGAVVAYNLDGGGSSTMVFDGALVNNPLGEGQERGTSDIIYVAG